MPLLFGKIDEVELPPVGSRHRKTSTMQSLESFHSPRASHSREHRDSVLFTSAESKYVNKDFLARLVGSDFKFNPRFIAWTIVLLGSIVCAVMNNTVSMALGPLAGHVSLTVLAYIYQLVRFQHWLQEPDTSTANASQPKPIRVSCYRRCLQTRAAQRAVNSASSIWSFKIDVIKRKVPIPFSFGVIVCHLVCLFMVTTGWYRILGTPILTCGGEEYTADGYLCKGAALGSNYTLRNGTLVRVTQHPYEGVPLPFSTSTYEISGSVYPTQQALFFFWANMAMIALMRAWNPSEESQKLVEDLQTSRHDQIITTTRQDHQNIISKLVLSKQTRKNWGSWRTGSLALALGFSGVTPLNVVLYYRENLHTMDFINLVLCYGVSVFSVAACFRVLQYPVL